VRLLRGHAALVRELNAELQRDHGLTINDYEALLLLANGLETAGYIRNVTCATDGRVTYAVLTDSGRAKLDAASCSHVAAIAALFGDRYPAAELESLTELLGRLPGAGVSASCRPPA
jgi:hypothetical protein